MKKIKKTLENIMLKAVDRAIYMVETVAYENQGNILIRKGKTRLERSLRGLIYIPAYTITIGAFLIFIVPILICNGLDKLVGGKC